MATRNQEHQDKKLNATVKTKLAINGPRKEVYALLRKFENMPKYVKYLNSVKVLDNKTSEWQATTTKNSYKATIVVVDEVEGQMLKMEAFIGNELKGECIINFIDDGANTEIRAELRYHNPLGGVASLFGPVVDGMIKEPKREFKEAVEADL